MHGVSIILSQRGKNYRVAEKNGVSQPRQSLEKKILRNVGLMKRSGCDGIQVHLK